MPYDAFLMPAPSCLVRCGFSEEGSSMKASLSSGEISKLHEEKFVTRPLQE